MWINKMVEGLCARHGLECIDLTTAFSNDYKATAQRFDFPTDGHWNEHAHFLASEVLHDYLIATEQ